VIEEFGRLTGITTVINTSFNMHEEPIVCSPRDAVRAFLLGHLDYLAIGSFLVPSPKPVERDRGWLEAAKIATSN
jgi:carbamoyltransferase